MDSEFYKVTDKEGWDCGTISNYGGRNRDGSPWGGYKFSPSGCGGRKAKCVEGATDPRQSLPGWCKNATVTKYIP